MSASDPNSAIYVTDSVKDIKNKIYIPIKCLSFFLEDDAELEHIKKEYGAGRMLTGEVKQRLVQVLTELVERHRTTLANVTEEVHTKLITFFFNKSLI
ncbi:unnamed protein product [Trifolium pratense]|uniref:Uncharacterized protein n=1 Tax=Trifolium pratense TaxID=57577 RepID=A0ACB0KJ17_TRIPR|nr:unnamed protein product [Trifolium pratense]